MGMASTHGATEAATKVCGNTINVMDKASVNGRMADATMAGGSLMSGMDKASVNGRMVGTMMVIGIEINDMDMASMCGTISPTAALMVSGKTGTQQWVIFTLVTTLVVSIVLVVLQLS